MVNKYENVRANDMYIGTGKGEVRVTEESQLDRVERKVDKLLNLIEDKEHCNSNNNEQSENKTLVLQSNKGNVERSWL